MSKLPRNSRAYRERKFRFVVFLSSVAIGHFYLRLVFAAYGKLDWSFLLTIEIRVGLFGLRWKIGLVFLAYGSPRPEI